MPSSVYKKGYSATREEAMADFNAHFQPFARYSPEAFSIIGFRPASSLRLHRGLCWTHNPRRISPWYRGRFLRS